MSNKRFFIQPYRPLFISSVFLFFLSCALTMLGKWHPRFYWFAVNVPFSVMILAFYSRSFVLEPDQFVVKLFGIPVRKINWHDVHQILFFRKWDQGGKVQNISHVVVVVGDIEPFMSTQEKIWRYLDSHPINAIQIFLPPQNIDGALAAFGEVWGNVPQFDQ